MIIQCPACSRKFNIDERLIPGEGRLLKCGNCEHTWFFKKEENIKKEAKTPKISETEENKKMLDIYINYILQNLRTRVFFVK